jgi:hypothetical protein
VLELNGGPVDLALDIAPVGGASPEHIQAVGGDPNRAMTISDFGRAAGSGVRATFREDRSDRVEAPPEFAQLAAEGRFAVPVARTFPLEDRRSALEISQGGHVRVPEALTDPAWTQAGPPSSTTLSQPASRRWRADRRGDASRMLAPPCNAWCHDPASRFAGKSMPPDVIAGTLRPGSSMQTGTAAAVKAIAHQKAWPKPVAASLRPCPPLALV